LPRTQRRSRNSSVPIWRRTWNQLTPEQRRIQEKSLEALSLVRREKLSLWKASEQVGLHPGTVRRNTSAFRKVRLRWNAKPLDRIPRVMVTYEKGRKSIVEIANSRTASLIGEYHNRVRQFLDTGKSSFLRELPRKRFKDIKGRTHTLETNPKAVLAVEARDPLPEFREIYRW
jgi:hypothetical protein